jgi:retinol-binding protein 3
MAIVSTMVSGALAAQDASAQAGAQAHSAAMSANDKQLVIEAAKRELNQRYVFEDVAQKTSAMLTEKMSANAYAQVSDAIKFAEKLTEDIQSVTRDKHIRVRFSAEPIPERANAQQPSAAEIAAERREAERNNFGIERVERLPINIGYIDLRGFETAAWASESLTAAMSLIANTDALIVDLRNNGGGDPQTVAWMTSYLVDERTHLNSFFYREDNKTEQFWTNDYVPGKKFGGKKPIYVLTAKRTFSAAEEFSYNMKAMKRGTIVGETTGGGANPGDSIRLTAHFTMFIPNARAVNPITKTNWEGVGVVPNVSVAADDALRTAQILALKKIAAGEGGATRKSALLARISELERDAPR